MYIYISKWIDVMDINQALELSNIPWTWEGSC